MGKQRFLRLVLFLFFFVVRTAFSDSLDHWTLRTTNCFNCIAFGGGKFVGVGNNGLMMESPDGVTWTQIASGTTNHLRSVAYGTPLGLTNAMFIAVGDNGAVTSGSVSSPYNFTSITFGGGRFIAAAYAAPMATNEPNIFIYKPFTLPSPTWQPIVMGLTEKPIPLGPISHSFHLGYGNGKYVAVGNIADGIWTSATGTTWTNQGQSEIEYYYGITYGNGLFVTAGTEGPIRISSDGVNWTSTYGNYMTSIMGQLAYGQGMFLASGVGYTDSANSILVSTDGIAWTSKVITNISADFCSAAYGNGTFVVSSTQPGIGTFQSDNLKRSSITNLTRSAEGIDLDLSVEYGASYTIEVSQDLKNWTNLVTFTSTNNTSRITHTNALSQGRWFYRASAQ